MMSSALRRTFLSPAHGIYGGTVRFSVISSSLLRRLIKQSQIVGYSRTQSTDAAVFHDAANNSNHAKCPVDHEVNILILFLGSAPEGADVLCFQVFLLPPPSLDSG